MTRDEYLQIVDMYNDFLAQVELMRLELGLGIGKLEEQAELSEDEEEYLGWMQDVAEGMSYIWE